MMSPFGPARGKRLSFRTVFTSDTHLGTPGCRSDFLHRTACDNLFRVGDIIDGWRLRRSWYWDETHDRCCACWFATPRGAEWTGCCT
jgi:hypothetical protein